MNKLIGVAVIIGAVVLAKRYALDRNGLDFERVIERMPDKAPPKWVFQNVSAIRQNTDRILELLDSQHEHEPAGP